MLPVLEYGEVVLCNLNERQIYNLELIQKRAGRIVCGGTKGTSKHEIYLELGWESLEKGRDKHCILFFHKIVHGQVPAFLSDMLPGFVAQRTNYNLHNINNIDIMPSRIDVLHNFFFPFVTRLLNNQEPDGIPIECPVRTFFPDSFLCNI